MTKIIIISILLLFAGICYLISIRKSRKLIKKPYVSRRQRKIDYNKKERENTRN